MADAIQVDVMNTALAALGQEPVIALDDAALQQSVAATKLLRHMETSRDTVLRRHGWLCALEYAALPPSTLPGYANWRYPYVYMLPGNALRVWEIEGVLFNGQETCWGPRWQVGTIDANGGSAQQIVRSTSSDTLNLAYVRRANWAALDKHVLDAIGYEIAARGAYAVTGDRGKAKDAKAEAEAKVMLAISTDGTQEGGQPPWAPSIPQMLRNHSR